MAVQVQAEALAPDVIDALVVAAITEVQDEAILRAAIERDQELRAEARDRLADGDLDDFLDDD